MCHRTEYMKQREVIKGSKFNLKGIFGAKAGEFHYHP